MPPRPYVLLSCATSADGYLDDARPQRLILSGPADLDRVDEVRAGCDAILVGAGTVRQDIDADEVLLLVGFLWRLDHADWENRSRHLLDLVMDGLRPAGHTPLQVFCRGLGSRLRGRRQAVDELPELLGRHRLSELVAEPGERERMRVLSRETVE